MQDADPSPPVTFRIARIRLRSVFSIRVAMCFTDSPNTRPHHYDFQDVTRRLDKLERGLDHKNCD